MPAEITMKVCRERKRKDYAIRDTPVCREGRGILSLYGATEKGTIRQPFNCYKLVISW